MLIPDSAALTEDKPLHLTVLVVTPRDILLKRLEQQQSLSSRWISIPQNHAFSTEDLETSAFVRKEIERLSDTDFAQIQRSSEMYWREHWFHSAVEFDNKDLERIWYQNQYFLACCLRKHKVAPVYSLTGRRVMLAQHGMATITWTITVSKYIGAYFQAIMWISTFRMLRCAKI